MYSWQHFIKLPGIKDLDPREQYRRYSNLMLEASNNNAAAASSAAAGAGAGGGTPAWRRTNLTGDNGVLFLDNYDTNYKFFIIDENGINSNRIDTGIVANDWYNQDYFSLQSKGYVIVFRNEEDETIYQFLFVRANGTIAASNIVNSGTDNENLPQWDQKDGKYFFYNEELPDNSRNIVYFDGDEVYTHTFEFDPTVASNSNSYIYETEGWEDGSTSFDDEVSASGLIVYDVVGADRDSGYISTKWYSLHKGTTTELFVNDENYNLNIYSDVSWDFQSSFLTNLRFDGSIYSDINFYNTETGDVQTISLTASGTYSVEYTNVDYLYYGTGKFGALFSNDSAYENGYLVVTYDGVRKQAFTKLVPRVGTGEWDFFATTKTPSFRDRNFISENIVFVFQNNGVYTDPLYYWDNISFLGVFDGATQNDLITLDGYGIDSVYGSGMFTENVFTMLADSTGTASNPGQAAQLIIDANGYTFSNFGFSMSSYTNFNPYQLDDSYVYKFYFEADRDEFQKFDTDGTRLMTATFSPNNGTWNTGKLFVIDNNIDNITYFSNETTIGLSPSNIQTLGLTVSKSYDDETWSTYYNKPINDGKLLLSGNDYSAVDNFVLLTSSNQPVYYDFSYLNDMDGWNVYLCKTFIIVQFQDVDGNGFARTYDHNGTLTQDLSFGYCEWISNDSVVGDIGVLRFTNWGTTKRVFLTKDTYSEYDLDWDPYNHWTIFNDYYWWRD